MSIESVWSFPFKATDKLFLDANVWFYIYFSDVAKQRPEEAIYSAAWKDILAKQSKVYVDALVVSEIINSYAKSIYGRRKRQGANFRCFKTFRQSPEFKSVAAEIARQVKRILRYCTLIESGFASLRLNSLLDVYARGGVDFNDQILVEICRTNGYLFITHDKDFADMDIPVLTANDKLLRRAAQIRDANR